MDTHPHLRESPKIPHQRTARLRTGFISPMCGKVEELFSQNDAETWIEDLWDMYTGFTLFNQEAGYDPRSHGRFVSFKELVFFFQEVGKMMK